jgi:Trypsin
MIVRKRKFRSAMPLLLLLAAVPAHSVTIQYFGGFGTGSGNFTGVANLGGCSGALLADGMHVITAAHCAATISVGSGGQTVLTSNGIDHLFFFTGTNPGGISDAVTGVHFNPLSTMWFSPDPNFGLMYDLAILDLAAPAPADATRYNLDLSGFAIANNSAVTMAGWGLGGFPGGSVAGTGGTRRAGTNTVFGVFTTADDPGLPGDPSVALTDSPIALRWTTTSDINTPSNTLGLSNAGDSGGPLLFNGNLIGVTSFGSVPRSGTIPIGQTFEAGYVNLANPGNAGWLNSLLAAPEPGTWMLAAGGGLLMWLCRRAIG